MIEEKIREECLLRGLKENTIKQYIYAYKRFKEQSNGIINEESIKKFLTTKGSNDGNQNNSINRSMLKLLCKIKLVDIDIPRIRNQDRKIPQTITKNKAYEIIKEIEGIYGVCVRLMFETGLRVSEAISLVRIQINESEGYIRIDDSKSMPRLVYPSPKLLKKILELAQKSPNKYIFYSNRSKTGHIAPQTINRKIKESHPEGHAHLFRHSFATHIYSKTGDLLAVKNLLGHKNVETTSIYTHISNKAAREANKQIYDE